MGMIHVTGNPRHGKSSYVAARVLVEDIQNRGNERYKKFVKYLQQLAKRGIIRSLPPYRHLVYGNLRIWKTRPFMCSYPMSGFEFGVPNKHCPQTKPLVKWGVYVFDEARKYFGSKSDNRDLPPWVVQAFEQHGHIFLKIFLITHRPEELNKDIRPLCDERIHIEKSWHYYKIGKQVVKSDKFLNHGRLFKTVWYGRQFDNLNDHENYVDGKDKDAGKPYKYVFYGAINKHYNSTQFAEEVEDYDNDFRYLDDDICDNRPESWSNYKKEEKRRKK